MNTRRNNVSMTSRHFDTCPWLEMSVTKVTRGGGGIKVYVGTSRWSTHTHTLNLTYIHSSYASLCCSWVIFGVRCIYNGPWTCRYTPRHNLKHRTFLFVDIAEVGTHSVLSSNQNQAYIGCRLETLKYWPTLHGIGVYIGVVKSCGVKRLAFYCSNVMSPTFRTYN